MMAGPLLETKFHVPRAHGPRVSRSRLSDRIWRATRSTLTLVSAPAGFGKTTLMAELAGGRPGDPAVAWLSLDPGDSDPRTFWTYVIGAMERAVPGVGEPALSVIGEGHGAVDAALTTLLNTLAALPGELVLVLDDMHVVEDPGVYGAMTSFLERLPAGVHVVIGTRADPPLPLARLRARGALTEIRAEDLRFDVGEATAYLNDAVGLALSAADVGVLEARTEGWIAALQLAGLSIQGRDDASAFIESFAGDDRYIVDYLVEEVLRRQPEGVRDFLLRTSILGRLTGPLCDAVTERSGGRATLETLDRGNLFLIALDDRRRWYRYHHLFAGVLQIHLRASLADEIPVLHQRASTWYEANGDRPEAIRHALEGKDFGRAADLVELEMPEMRRLRREPGLRRWLERLPDEVVRVRPVLSTGFAGTLLSLEHPDGVDRLLTQAEAWLAIPIEEAARRGMVVADREAFARLPAGVELSRAALAKVRGDLAGNLAHARRVLDMVGDTDNVGRGGAEAFLGLAHWGMGDLEEGYRWFEEGMATLDRIGHTTDVVGGSVVLADVRLAQGRLGAALGLYEDGLRRATASGGAVLRGARDMHTGIAGISYERNDLATAKAHLDEGRRLGDEHAFPRDPYLSRLVAARLAQASGDVDGAISLLDEAGRLYLSDYSPDVRPVAAQRARLQVAHGRLAEARRWADEQGVTAATEVTYLRAYELITYARLLVAEGLHDPTTKSQVGALDLTDRLLTAAMSGGHRANEIETRIVQALARHAAGDVDAALSVLASVIELAEPEGYVRVFLDEGPAMTALLRAAAKQPDAPAYARRLLEATVAPVQVAPSRQPLAEPLSERELEVLRLLQGDLDGPELARHLYVSVNTLRTHTRNIYAKLGVSGRRAAVRRATELGLLVRAADQGPAA